MAEAANKRCKYLYLLKQQFQSLRQLKQYLPKMCDNENSRFHYSLLGFSSNEVLAGKIPNTAFFKSQIQQAMAYRRTANRVSACEAC